MKRTMWLGLGVLALVATIAGLSPLGQTIDSYLSEMVNSGWFQGAVLRGPTIGRDGMVTQHGKPIARIEADGSVMDLTRNKPVDATITADKVQLSWDGMPVVFELSPTGVFTTKLGGQVDTGAKPAHVEGATTPEQRRSLLTIFVATTVVPPSGNARLIERTQIGGTIAIEGPHNSAMPIADKLIAEHCGKYFVITAEGEEATGTSGTETTTEFRLHYQCKPPGP